MTNLIPTRVTRSDGVETTVYKKGEASHSTKSKDRVNAVSTPSQGAKSGQSVPTVEITSRSVTVGGEKFSLPLSYFNKRARNNRMISIKRQNNRFLVYNETHPTVNGEFYSEDDLKKFIQDIFPGETADTVIQRDREERIAKENERLQREAEEYEETKRWITEKLVGGDLERFERFLEKEKAQSYEKGRLKGYDDGYQDGYDSYQDEF